MPVVKVKLGLAYPIEGDSHGAMINRTAVKKKGGGKYYSTRYKSGPQRGSGPPRYQQSTEALGPQGCTECLQDVSLWCPSPFGSILGVTMSIMHACGLAKNCAMIFLLDSI